MSDGRRPRLLFLAHLLPWPLTGGGQIKSYYTLRLLSSRFDITLLAFVRRDEETAPENLTPLETLCRGGVHTVRLPRGHLRDAAVAAACAVTGRSFLLARDDIPAMRAAVRAELASGGYAAVHVDHLHMAQFVPDEIGGAKVVLDEHNVEHELAGALTPRPLPLFARSSRGRGSLNRGQCAKCYPAHKESLVGSPFPARNERIGEGGGGLGKREAAALRRAEIAACRRADRVVFVSDADRQAMLGLAPEIAAKSIVTPIGVDLDYWKSVPWQEGIASGDLLTVGTLFWPPNVDGLRWFCTEILPRIRAERTETRLNVVGARPGRAMRRLTKAYADAVRLFADVPDVRPFAETCGVFVAPLRFGSGVRVKLLNALAMGLPVVATTVAASGIEGLRDGEHLLLADTPGAFADAVLRLLGDRAEAARLGDAGRALMERQYGWETTGQRLLSAYDDLLPTPKGTAKP